MYDHISETSKVDLDMIPEVVIRRLNLIQLSPACTSWCYCRQIPRKDLDLESLRHFAERGKISGRKGPETYMYRKVQYHLGGGGFENPPPLHSQDK